MKLHVAHELTLPLELAGRTQVILAQKGAGKTYTAMREAEQLLDAGQQIVALDPTGVWWGLHSPAAGGGKGFGIIVMGGDHGDLPLEPSAGTIVADFVAESRESVVLDLSGFESNAAQNRFVTDFAERLYRAKASDRRTIHLMLDEADSFCPQRPMPGEARMLGAFEAIVRRGRSRGIGITLISQRPAVLNKNVMSQADLLVCLRVVGQHDHKALREWTNLYATGEQQKEFMASLPTLRTGEAWFWSPSWLNIFQRAQVTKRVSYDSSATPDASDKKSAPAPTVKVDLAKLSAAIRETAERAEANDPRKLKERIEELQRENAKLQSSLEHRPKESVLTAKEKQQLAAVQQWIERGFDSRIEAGRLQIEKTMAAGIGIVRDLAPILSKSGYANMQISAPNLHNHSRPQMAAITRKIPFSDRCEPTTKPATGIGSGERRVLAAIAQHDNGVTPEQLTVLTGYKRSSRNTYLQRLSSAGLTQRAGERIEATSAGVELLGDDYERLPTGASLQDYWLGKLTGGERAILDFVLRAHPQPVDREAMGSSLGYQRSSRNTYIQRLQARELVSGGRELLASPQFFD